MIRKRTGVVLPYNSPSVLFDELSSKVFHPMALLNTPKRSTEEVYKFPHCFTGYGSVQIGVKYGLDVTVMVGDTGSAAENSLIECMDNFIDPQNPFAAITVQRTSSTTIADQLNDFFRENEEYDSAVVVWPYQHFVFSETGMFEERDNFIKFTFTHPLATLKRDRITECIVLAAKDVSSTSEIECSYASSVGTVDDILKGACTRVLSTVDVDREDFEEWRRLTSYPHDISMFLGVYLKGTTGTMLQCQSHTFIV